MDETENEGVETPVITTETETANPLHDLVTSDQYAFVRDAVHTLLATQFASEAGVHLMAIRQGMMGLRA